MQELTEQHTPSYSFLLEDSDGSSYLAAVECLDATTDFTVEGLEFTAWFTLIPPSEGRTGSCSVPADSPLTPFNETALFNTSKGACICVHVFVYVYVHVHAYVCMCMCMFVCM